MKWAGRIGWLAALAVATVAASTPPGRSAPARATPADRPVNVIFLIADGCGPASMGLARAVADHPLVLDSIEVGSITTHSASSRVTDSGAAATALASGVKTGNGMVGVDPTGRHVPTIMEAAKAKGMATGLVVKSTITDATPAAFAAHVLERSSEDSVADQELERRVDVMLGGGRGWFLPAGAGGSRKDGRDLVQLARSRGYTYVEDRAALAQVRTAPVLGLFADENMSYALDRDDAKEPDLPAMARKAIQLLAGRPKGFFLMIEGSRIDHAGHANDPACHARELLEYDEVVRLALEFARRDRRTLVISTADHETGGLSLGCRFDDKNFYEMDPAPLRNVTASTERMADSIKAGAHADEVVARMTGSPPTREESAHLQVAVMGGKEIARAIAEIESHRARVGWTTRGHTGVDVGFYAYGPGSGRFRGLHDNTDVAHILADLLGVTLGSAPGAGAASIPATPSR